MLFPSADFFHRGRKKEGNVIRERGKGEEGEGGEGVVPLPMPHF